MKAVILAAGIGSRLGSAYPKPLIRLAKGYSIMQHQIENLLRYFSVDDIYAVVGFKKELIMEAFPDVAYIYNNYYTSTNTSKSLLKALRKLKNEDVLWLNGDVVFEHWIIDKILNFGKPCMAVNKGSTSQEEIKYTLSHDGLIKEVSKRVQNALGEALGINFIDKKNVSLLIQCLEACKNTDFFERGIEIAIKNGLKIYPVDVSNYLCVEVDFKKDLKRASKLLIKIRNK